MKVHHTTVIEKMGNCAICGKPFLYYWKDASEKNGNSDQYTKKDGKTVHFRCTGGKTLHQLNEERKKKDESEKKAIKK